mgnify:CR=1 FL=1
MSNRKSYLGKLYDTVQQEVDENAWVTELVDNIKTGLNYSILAEKQKLPISCTMYKSKTTILTDLTEVQTETVIEALKAEGIVAEYVVAGDFVYFKVTELL